MRSCFFDEITALLPVAEVGFVDGLAAKWAARMAWTSGRRLSQEREVLGQLAVLEALVKLLADGQGEPGDFAVGRHRGPLRAWHCFHAGQR